MRQQHVQSWYRRTKLFIQKQAKHAPLYSIGLLGLAMLITVISLQQPHPLSQHAAGTTTVSLLDDGIQPSTITIQAGDTVTWTNTSNNIPHTVTSSTGVWDSGNLNPGATFSYQFTTPGTYNYKCLYHPDMVGTITVLAAAQPTDTPIPPTNTPAVIPPTASPVAQAIATPTLVQQVSTSSSATPTSSANKPFMLSINPTATPTIQLTTTPIPTNLPTPTAITVPSVTLPEYTSPEPPILVAHSFQVNWLVVFTMIDSMLGVGVIIGVIILKRGRARQLKKQLQSNEVKDPMTYHVTELQPEDTTNPL